MANTYTWKTKQCDVYPTKSGKSNVVWRVHWRLYATDGTNTSELYGSQDLDTSDLSSFTNWSSLDEATVQGWVESAIGSDEVAAMKTKLDARLTEMASPTTTLKELS